MCGRLSHMTLSIEDIYLRLTQLGLKQKEKLADGGTLWKRKKTDEFYEIPATVPEAVDELRRIEVIVAGGELEAGRAQAIEMLTLLADSRERYRGGPEEMDRVIATEVNAMRNAIKVLQGERYTAYGIMHSWTWGQFEKMAERHGLELQGEPLG